MYCDFPSGVWKENIKIPQKYISNKDVKLKTRKKLLVHQGRNHWSYRGEGRGDYTPLELF